MNSTLTIREPQTYFTLSSCFDFSPIPDGSRLESTSKIGSVCFRWVNARGHSPAKRTYFPAGDAKDKPNETNNENQ